MNGYTPELKELIKKVEASRPARVERARKNQHFPALTMEQRKEWLSKYHPDYKSDGRRAAKVGPNKGMCFLMRWSIYWNPKAESIPKPLTLPR